MHQYTGNLFVYLFMHIYWRRSSKRVKSFLWEGLLVHLLINFRVVTNASHVHLATKVIRRWSVARKNTAMLKIPRVILATATQRVSHLMMARTTNARLAVVLSRNLLCHMTCYTYESSSHKMNCCILGYCKISNSSCLFFSYIYIYYTFLIDLYLSRVKPLGLV